MQPGRRPFGGKFHSAQQSGKLQGVGREIHAAPVIAAALTPSGNLVNGHGR
jgi:hypothetical protein